MDILQITYAMSNLSKFLGFFPSDLLRHSVPSAGTVLIDTDTHTKRFTVANHLQEIAQCLLLRFVWCVSFRQIGIAKQEE